MVVSYEYKEELKARLYDFNSNIKSIYEIFDNSKIHFKQDFYDIYGLIYHDFRTGQVTRDFACFDIMKYFLIIADVLNLKRIKKNAKYI